MLISWILLIIWISSPPTDASRSQKATADQEECKVLLGQVTNSLISKAQEYVL